MLHWVESRYNVDPFKRHSDADILAALSAVNMTKGSSTPDSLGLLVAENGSNLRSLLAQLAY